MQESYSINSSENKHSPIKYSEPTQISRFQRYHKICKYRFLVLAILSIILINGQLNYSAALTIRFIFLDISSGERTKSIHPLAIALIGISGCDAVSGF